MATITQGGAQAAIVQNQQKIAAQQQSAQQQAAAAMQAAMSNPNSTNQYGMTLSQWNTYQSEMANSRFKVGPAQYMWQKDPNAGGVPPSDQYIQGGWTPAAQYISAAQAQLNAVNALETEQEKQLQAQSTARAASAAQWQKDAVIQEAKVQAAAGTTHGNSGATANNQRSGVTSAQLALNAKQNETQKAAIVGKNTVLVPSAIKDIIDHNDKIAAISAINSINKASNSGNMSTSDQLRNLQTAKMIQKAEFGNNRATDNASVAAQMAANSKLTTSQLMRKIDTDEAREVYNQQHPENAVIETHKLLKDPDNLLKGLDAWDKQNSEQMQALNSPDNGLMAKNGSLIKQIEGSGKGDYGYNVKVQTPVGKDKNGNTLYYSFDKDAESANTQRLLGEALFGKQGYDGMIRSNQNIIRIAENQTPRTLSDVQQDFRNQKADEDYQAQLKLGGVFALSAQANKSLNSILDYNNVISQIGNAVNAGNSKLAPITEKIPNQNQVYNARVALLGSHANDLQPAIINNKYLNQWSRATKGEIDYIKTHPVNTAIDAVAAYAGGEVIGAGLELGTSAIEGGAAKLALSNIAKNSAAIKNIGTIAANYARPAINTAMVGDLGLSGYQTFKQGDIGKDLQFIGNLALAGKGYEKGVEAVHDPISVIPGLHGVDVKELGGSGTSQNTKNIHVGTSLEIAGRNIASHDYTGFHLGTADINPESIGTKQVQPFDVRGSKAFEKYIKNSDIISNNDKIYAIAGKSVADSAYTASEPIVTPKSFQIVSKDVPDNMKPVLRDTIVNFKKGITTRALDTINGIMGKADYTLQVAGSNPTKLQMGDFFTRNVGDLEVYTKRPTEFVNKFIKTAAKNGFKEGRDFEITDKGTSSPKIAFKVDGKMQKGVEIFTPDHKAVEAKGKEDKLNNLQDSKNGFSSQEGIAYGYKELKSIVTDNVKMQKLQEQAIRKFAGATTLKGKSVEPVHLGRIKDARDLAEIGIGNKVAKNIGNVKDVIAYAKAVAEKYPEVADKSLGDEKAYSPIIEFVVKNNRLPTAKEIPDIVKGALKSGIGDEKELLFTNKNKSILENINKIAENSNSMGTKAIADISTSSSRSAIENKSSSVNIKSSQSIKTILNDANNLGKIASSSNNRIEYNAGSYPGSRDKGSTSGSHSSKITGSGSTSNKLTSPSISSMVSKISLIASFSSSPSPSPSPTPSPSPSPSPKPNPSPSPSPSPKPNPSPSPSPSPSSGRSMSMYTLGSKYQDFPKKRTPSQSELKKIDATKKQFLSIEKTHRLLKNQIPNLQSMIG